MKNSRSAEEDGNPSRTSFCLFPGFACLLFTSPNFLARSKRRLKRSLWRREGLALFASRSETWKSETNRHFILAPESLVLSISFPHSGQTHCACPVPAKSAPYKRPKFPKPFALMPNVKAVTDKLRFIHHIRMHWNLIIIHCASQLELFFQNAIFTTFFLQTSHRLSFPTLTKYEAAKTGSCIGFCV